MHCIYAFLTFSTAQRPLILTPLIETPPHSLVIVGDSNEPIYGVYKPLDPDPFPLPTPKSGVIMSYQNVASEGAYLAAYCSRTLSLQQINTLVICGLETIPQFDEDFVDSADISVATCYHHLNQLSSSLDLHATVTLTAAVRDGKCSVRVISYLASKNKVSLGGYFRGFLPPGKPDSFSVIAHEPIEINNVILPGLVVKGKLRKTKYQALAWFQGNLHLFEINSSNMWYLKTKLHLPMKNGRELARFFEHNFRVVRRLDERLRGIQNDLDFSELPFGTGSLADAPANRVIESSAALFRVINLVEQTYEVGWIGAVPNHVQESWM